MPISAPARVLVHPNRIEPNLIITIAQPSGFMQGLGGRKLRQLLSDNDKVVYQNHLDVRTAVAVQQAAANVLRASASCCAGCPTLVLRCCRRSSGWT